MNLTENQKNVLYLLSVPVIMLACFFIELYFHNF